MERSCDTFRNWCVKRVSGPSIELTRWRGRNVMRTPELVPSLTGNAHHLVFTSSFRRAKTYTQRACAVLVLASALALAVHYWPRPLLVCAPKLNQVISQTEKGTRVYVPNRELVGELSHFDDGLFAHLMFDYYRGRRMLRNSSLLLISGEESG